MTLSWTCLEKQRKIVCLSATEKIIAQRRLPPHFYQRLACLHDVVMLELSTVRFNKAKSSTLSPRKTRRISAFQPNDLSGWEINAPVGKLEVLSISRGWWELKGVQEGTLWVGLSTPQKKYSVSALCLSWMMWTKKPDHNASEFKLNAWYVTFLHFKFGQCSKPEKCVTYHKPTVCFIWSVIGIIPREPSEWRKKLANLLVCHFIVGFCRYCSVVDRFSDFHLQLLPFNNEDKNSHDPTLL